MQNGCKHLFGGKMKSKRISRVLTIILTMIFSCAIFAFFSAQNKNYTNAYALGVEQVENKIDYQSIVEYSCDVNEFTADELDKFAAENEYYYFTQNNKICFYNKFALTSLSVLGEFDSSAFKNATKNGSTTNLKFDTVEQTKQAYQKLEQNKNLIVVIDRISQANILNTSGISSQAYGWGYDAIDVAPYQEYLADMNTTEEVVVAVIDTGINTSHNMFKNRIVTDANGNYVGIAETETTYTYSGYEFEDDNGHGTHVSGIICDTTPSNVKILPVKLLNYQGSFSYSSLIFYESLFNKIVELKKTYNIVCVNMSFGADGATSTEVTQVNYYFQNILIKNNILPITAAGNKIPTSSGGDGTCHDISVKLALPASCSSGVTVSALGHSGSNYYYDGNYSYYGSLIDVSAPGTSIRSAWIASSNKASAYTYKTESGTSMATPYVSAVVALLCLDPIYTGNADVVVVEQRMYELATDLGDEGKDIYYGHGMVSLKGFKGGVEYTANDVETKYDGDYHNIEVNVTNVSGYTIKYGLSKSSINLLTVEGNNQFKNYTNGQMIVYFIISAKDMTDTFGFAYLQINKASIVINIQDQYGSYGDEPSLQQNKYSIQSGQIYGTDDLNLNLTTSAKSNSKPGSYDISFGWNNENYDVSCSNLGSYIIERRDVSIKLNNQQAVYGNDIVLDNSKYTVESGSIVSASDFALTLKSSAEVGNVVGNYDISVSGYNEECYNLVNFVEGVLAITKRPITITIEQQVVYGDQCNLDLQNYSIVSGSVFGDDVLLEKISTNAKVGDSVGNYSISVDRSNSNYNLTLKSGTLKITKRSATLNVGKQSTIYGDEISLNQQNYTVQNLVAGDDLNVSLYTNATSSSPVTENGYTIYANCSNSNYMLSIVTGKLSVLPREVKIYFYQEFAYGEKINLDFSLYQDVENKVLAGDDLDLQMTCSAVQYDNVGDYNVEIAKCNSNYSLILTNESKVKITPRAATVKVGNLTKTYGEEIDINQTKVDLTQVLYRDRSKLNYRLTLNGQAKDVGSYEIDFVYSNNNYNITVEKGNLSITARPITILVQKSVCYGDVIDLTNVEYSVTSTNKIVDGDDLMLNLKISAVQFSPVGKYSDFVIVSANKNYNVTILSSSFVEITKKQISVKIGDASSKFGEEIDLSKVAVDTSEVLNGDNLDITLSTTATPSSPAGQYPITLTYNNANYDVTVIKGSYHVYYKVVHVSVENQNSVYGNEIVLNQTAYSIEETDVQKSDLQLTFATNATSKSNVGEYEIFATSYADNYQVVCTNGKLTISARPIKIKVEQSVCYGSEFNFDGVFVDVDNQLVNNDNLNLILSSSDRTLYSSIGEYSLTVDESNKNYIVSLSNDSILKVLPRKIIVAIGKITKVYGDEVDLSSVEIDLSQLVNNDNLNIEISTNATQVSDVGNYFIDLSYSNPNYDVTVEKGVLQITPKPIVVNIQNVTSQYGDDFELPTSLVSAVDGEDIAALGVKLNTEANNRSVVGQYLITAACENKNYTLTTATNAYVNITKKDARLVVGNKQSIYGDEIDLSNVQTVAEGVLFDDDLGTILSTTASKTSSIGDYPISAETTNPNYNVTVVDGNLKIVAKTVVLKVQQTGVYGDVHTVDSTDFVDVEQAVLDGDDLKLRLSVDVGQFDPVGNYSISATSDNANYLVDLQDSFYQITPRQASVQIGNAFVVYGELVDESQIQATQNGVLNNDNLTLTFVYDVNSTTCVGEYDIGAIAANVNYNVEVNKGKITVLKRGVELFVVDQMQYGEDEQITNNYMLISGDVVNNDDLNLQLISSATNRSPVGEYALQVYACNPNYNVTLTENSCLTIVPRTINVKVGNKKATYLDDVDLQDVQIDLSELLDGDDLNCTLSTTAQKTSDAGSYEIDLTASNANYNVVVEKGSYIVVAKNVQIQILNCQIVYGDEIDETLFDFNCVDETLNKQDLGVELCTTAKQFDAVGSYPIKVKANSKNYNISSNYGRLKIVPRKLKIELKSQTKQHLTSLKPNQNDYSIVEGELCDGDNLNLKIKSDLNHLLWWGEFDLTGEVNNINYEVEIVDAKIKVEYSYVDTIAIVAIGLLIAVVIVFVARRKRIKAKGNVQYFNDAMQILKRDKNKK